MGNSSKTQDLVGILFCQECGRGGVDAVKKAILIDEEIDKLRDLLAMASCPNCDGIGSYSMAGLNGEVIQEQCRWCFEKNLLLNDKKG